MRPIVATSLLAACALMGAVASLAGCSRAGGAHHVRLPPSLSSAVDGGAINAGGEQPLWALQIRPKVLTFSSDKVAAIDLTNPGPTFIPGGGQWSGESGGRPFRARVLAQACHDAATGLAYPFAAEVEALGVTYRGCAARAGQGMGPQPQAQ